MKIIDTTEDRENKKKNKRVNMTDNALLDNEEEVLSVIDEATNEKHSLSPNALSLPLNVLSANNQRKKSINFEGGKSGQIETETNDDVPLANNDHIKEE